MFLKIEIRFMTCDKIMFKASESSSRTVLQPEQTEVIERDGPAVTSSINKQQ